MKSGYILVLSVALVFALFLLNIFHGAVEISPVDTLRVLTGQESDAMASSIILSTRLPQACVACLAGAALAISGLMLQTLFANPLADASILGIHSGAGLGAALVIMATGGMAISAMSGYALLLMAALTGAVAVMILLLAFSAKVSGNVLLLVIGVMVSYVISSMISLLSYVTTADSLQNYFLWGMGSVSNVSLSRLPVFAVLVLVGLLAALLQAKALNAMLMGDHYANNVGISLRRTRTAVLLVVGVLSAIVVAFCGPIAFIGLAVPHMARMIVGTENHLILMPVTLLMGAAMALICNFFTTFAVVGILIPVNVITPFFGVPVIFYILWKKPLYRR